MRTESIQHYNRSIVIQVLISSRFCWCLKVVPEANLKRAVYKTRSASYQELLDLAKLPTLYYRRLQDIATLMFKVKLSLVPVNISDLFNLTNTQ